MVTVRYSVLPADASDMPTLAQFTLDHQLAQATNRFLFNDWPNVSAQMSRYLNTMEKAVKDPKLQIFKAVNDDSGETIAILMISRRKPEDAAALEEPRKLDTPPGVNLEFLERLNRTIALFEKEMMGIDYFYVDWVFVKQSNRIQGVGSHLVRMCLDKARAAGIPLFLVSVPSAHGFYPKFGFKDTVHADVDLSKWGPEYSGFGVYRLWGMLVSN